MAPSAPLTSASFSLSGSTPGVRSLSPSAPTTPSRRRSPGVGQGSSTTRPPGLLNEVTILPTIGAGQFASRSIGFRPAVHTVAGVGCDGPGVEPRDRERVVVETGVAGLTLVVVEAVG